MADLVYRWSLLVLPRLVVTLIRVWFATCRLRTRGEKQLLEMLAKGETGIAAFWHYSFLYFFYYFQKRSTSAAVMVSASRDGEYIARVARILGHVPVRGSSNRGGMQALREMINLLRQGTNGAIVADGSQGPARRVQPGCIFMASKSGRPIVPMAWAADRYFAFNSWDRTVIPYPFATVFLYQGEPLYVPPDLSSAQVESYRLALEDCLNRLYLKAWSEVGRPPHDIGTEPRT
ncbi:lysophospholipid acyltransferase family protein [Desulfobulbus alkaliphilus]|uniref:lysophospholipid acyltransferase family protein n=1 Tax=Desulfobulbus alkaliphilus TaxID=869814 RepID=UPI0019666C84|nr:lysophospholipid acyltransferase family protein [Desulfobulbus alkaliphilus]MBM9536495.1 lysophospholipid acyltransferase family protein [Desulfobulbus alkaliphilus]